MKRIFAALLFLGLAACGDKGGGGQAQPGEDPRYAGLEHEIRLWREEITKTDETCLSTIKDEHCVAFEVTCKVEAPVTDSEKTAGTAGKVIVALRWQGWNAEKGEHRSVLKAAEFSKTGAGWTRKDAGGVNPNTCAGY